MSIDTSVFSNDSSSSTDQTSDDYNTSPSSYTGSYYSDASTLTGSSNRSDTDSEPPTLHAAPTATTMVNVWDDGGGAGTWGLGNKRHFAATIVSTLIDFSDLIAANGDDIDQTTYPHGRWNNWFTATFNPSTDFCKDPRSFSFRAHMQAASFGLLADSARTVRDGVPFCGCEVAGGVPQCNTVGTKEHFLAWTDPVAQSTSTFVGKQLDPGSLAGPPQDHPPAVGSPGRGEDNLRVFVLGCRIQLSGPEHVVHRWHHGRKLEGAHHRRRHRQFYDLTERKVKAPTMRWTKVTGSKTPMPHALQRIVELYTKEFGASDVLPVDLRMIAGKVQKLGKRRVIALGGYLDQKFQDERVDVIRAFLESLFRGAPPTDLDEWELQILDEKQHCFDGTDFLTDKLSPSEIRELCRSALKVVKATVPGFLREFASPTNCFRDATTLECEVLLQFIHPLFKEAVFVFAQQTKWVSGEIGSEYLKGLTKADGLGIAPTNDDIPVCYFEGTRVRVRNSAKKKADADKLLDNGQHILRTIWQKLTESKRRLPAKLLLGTAQSYQTDIHLNVLEIIDTYTSGCLSTSVSNQGS
ncbi:hypothetical protein HDU86_008475 [Geranomyces michiganensis]|nr:hypothetical protein HDU86_008475 [Geranomyces michiganensis]